MGFRLDNATASETVEFRRGVRIVLSFEDLARSAPSQLSRNSVADLAATIAEKNVGSVVITNDETPVGIGTDRDPTVRVLGEETILPSSLPKT